MQTGNHMPTTDSLLAKARAFVKSDPDLARECKSDSQAVEMYQDNLLIQTAPAISMRDFAAKFAADPIPLSLDDLR